MRKCTLPERRKGAASFFFACIAMVAACSGPVDPDVARAQELSRFGVTAGQVADIVLAGHPVHLPSNWNGALYASNIKRGYADRMVYHVNYYQFDPRRGDPKENQYELRKRDGVLVTAGWEMVEDPIQDKAAPDANTDNGKSSLWKRSGEVWGLERFDSPFGTTTISYYKSIGLTTPRGSPWAFDCWPHSKGQNSYVCLTRFNHASGLGIEITSDVQQLPQWQAIVKAVMSSLDAMAAKS